MSASTDALWEAIDKGRTDEALRQVSRMGDRVEDRMMLASQFDLLIKTVDIVAELVPDNMPIHQLQVMLKYAHDTTIYDQDSKHMIASILVIGFAHLPSAKVSAAIKRSINAGRKKRANTRGTGTPDAS